MTRVLADLPPDDLHWLDRYAAERGTSRASVLREAVSTYRSQAQVASRLEALEQGFGAWKHRTDIGDSVEWQRRERAGSTRPWDDDYEAVKAEFPDLFDAEDDRQRQIYLDMQQGRYPEPIVPDRS
jgi:hypothetical protein